MGLVFVFVLGLAVLVSTAEGFGVPMARVPSALASRPHAVRMQSNIFEKAVSGVAGAVGKGLNKMTGLPELSEEEEKAMEQAMITGTLNFDQFLMQMRVITKAGSIATLASKIPGAPAVDPRAAAIAEEKLKRYEVYCTAMQADERADASKILPGSPDGAIRVERLAKSVGVSVEVIRQFLGEFVVMRKTSQAFAQKKSPAEVKAIMEAAQDELSMRNRVERRLDAKEAKKGKSKSSKGFGSS